MFVNHQSNAKNWRVECVDMMKIVEKVVIAAELGMVQYLREYYVIFNPPPPKKKNTFQYVPRFKV